jgi:1,4-alpha-glucan branching enzyme
MPERKPGTKGSTKVTFSLPKDVKAEEVTLCGDFNDWSTSATPLKKYKDGHFAVTVSLGEGSYRYKFLLDGDRWENDPEADDYAANPYGGEDSVIKV